jgi:flagellar hook-basal body complex protein FliE
VTVAVLPVSGLSISALTGVDTTSPVAKATGTAQDNGFAAVLAQQVDQLQAVQSHADSLAAQAATGDLRDVHDYMIASTEASLTTDMVVTIKNKAVDAFNEIMRMQV